MLPGERVQIGFVVRAHGVRGGLRVRATSDILLELAQVYVADRPMKVLKVQRERDEFLVDLAGVVDRDQAEALKGSPIYVERSVLPEPGDDELYVADLVGCQVFDAAGARLGEVKSTFFSGAHEILTVSDGAREFMLPFVESIVSEVDVAGRRIVCDPPEGLIDLDKGE